MIANERQLQITQSQIARFEDALAELLRSPVPEGIDPIVFESQTAAVRSQLDSLRAEVIEYERLKAGHFSTIDAGNLADLPLALIRARIAAGLTQRDLAGRLGMREQQIQRYEANLYEGASLSRVVEIADAIGVEVTNSVRILQRATPAQLLQRLGSAGLDATFIKRRIAPSVEESADDLNSVLSRVSRLFDWSPEHIMSTSPLEPPKLAAAMARFKMPKGRDARTAAAYTVYAYQLARICATSMREQHREAIPVRWREFRQRLLDHYSDVSLTSVLQFAWDLGVVVLPLNDPGAFHGAHWRIHGVNVVVLKQSTRHPARWLFDLLHELYHAGQEPEAEERELIELPETSDERRESDEERRAMFFAGNVGLGGRAEELTARVVKNAEGDLRRFKRVAVQVANESEVDVSLFANYLAFRLSLQGLNWWGAAANLQDVGLDPLALARDVFFERFQFEHLGEDDFELLRLALHDEVGHGR